MSKLSWYDIVIAVVKINKFKVTDVKYVYRRIAYAMKQAATDETCVYILKDFEIILPMNPVEKPMLKVKLRKIPILNKITIT